MISWSDELVEVIARRRCVVVIGAGVSRNSVNNEGKRPATWEEFLKECAKSIDEPEYINKLIEARDYLTACEIIKNKLTSDTFINKVEQEYQKAGYEPANIHESIYKLDVSVVVSPNFDSIYDNYATSVSLGTVTIKDHTSEDIANYLLGGNHRLILKSHGTINTPSKLIFTRKEYAEARTKYVLFYEILKSLALTHTFLFIGCGTDDPDIRTLFEDINFAHGRIPFHYMTLPNGEVHNDLLEIISDSMRIKFLKYSPEKNHSELTQSLDELVIKVEEYRDLQLKGSLKW